MTSDSFISKVKSIFPIPLSNRQAGSVATQGDGSQFSVGRAYPFKTISHSPTANLLATGSAEPKNDHEAGHTSSPGDPSPSTQPRTVNVVLFGETGVGKSSVINLIARKEVAKVSSDVNGCTMQSTRYDIPFDDMSFSIFDTIGLEEPQMGVNGYLKAIERAYELIVKLGAAGGIHLLLFCMRGGRITATTQSNYRLFCECLCNTKVPIALVFTGLEREVEMEDWWKRNKAHIEHYGIKSDGHACITAVQDEAPGEDLKYMESQKSIRELLKTCALKNEAFLPEPHTWFAKLGKGMRSFIEKQRNPKRRDVMRVLTNRCKLDPETARKIAEMMEKGDTETNDGNHREPVVANSGALPDQQKIAKMEKGDTETNDRNQGEQVGNEGGPNPVVGKDDNELVKASNSDALPNQQKFAEMIGRGNTKDQDEQVGDKEGKSGSNPVVGKDGNELVKKNAANSDALPNQHVNVAAPRNDAAEGKDKSKVVNEKVEIVNAPAIEPARDLGLRAAKDDEQPTPDSRGPVQARHDTKKKPGAGPFEVTLQSKSSESWQVISHGP